MHTSKNPDEELLTTDQSKLGCSKVAFSKDNSFEESEVILSGRRIGFIRPKGWEIGEMSDSFITIHMPQKTCPLYVGTFIEITVLDVEASKSQFPQASALFDYKDTADWADKTYERIAPMHMPLVKLSNDKTRVGDFDAAEIRYEEESYNYEGVVYLIIIDGFVKDGFVYKLTFITPDIYKDDQLFIHEKFISSIKLLN